VAHAADGTGKEKLQKNSADDETVIPTRPGPIVDRGRGVGVVAEHAIMPGCDCKSIRKGADIAAVALSRIPLQPFHCRRTCAESNATACSAPQRASLNCNGVRS
jgi:hypothetical protein